MAKVFVVQTVDGESHQATDPQATDPSEVVQQLANSGAFIEAEGGGVGFVPAHNIARVLQVDEAKVEHRVATFRFSV